MGIVLRVDTKDSSHRAAQTVAIRMDAIESAEVRDGYLTFKLSDYFQGELRDQEPPKRRRRLSPFGLI